jgi:hypothetical protein
MDLRFSKILQERQRMLKETFCYLASGNKSMASTRSSKMDMFCEHKRHVSRGRGGGGS